MISSCIEIDVLEGFGSTRAGLRVIVRLEELNVLIVRAIDSKLNSHIGRKVKVGVYKSLELTLAEKVQSVHVRWPLETLAGVLNL